MDFLDPKKRRSHRIRLFTGYGLMAIALTIAATVLFFEASGFDVDRETGELIQNGIMMVDAHPEPAQIFLNGQPKGTTGARFVIPEDRYTVDLYREGYHEWSRHFRLDGGSIERLVYPFLVPTDIERVDETLYSAVPAFMSQSPDRRWLITQPADKTLTFEIADLSQDPIRATSVNLDADLFSTEAETYNIAPVEWSDNNQHLIVKHSFEGSNEFIRIDRANPERSVNLTQALPVIFTSISLFDKSFDTYYLHNSTTNKLVRIKDSETQATPVADNVIAYKSHARNELVIVTQPSKNAKQVQVSVIDEDNTYPLRMVPTSNKGYAVDIARYDDDWVVVAASKTDNKAYVYQGDVFGELRSKKLLEPQIVLQPGENIVQGEFSANSRFYAVQSGSDVAVFDAEKERQYRYELDLPVSAKTKAYWMDGHRLTLVSEGQLFMFDYDGINVQALAPVAKSYGKPVFDRDYFHLFTMSESQLVEGRFSLLKSFMRASADR